MYTITINLVGGSNSGFDWAELRGWGTLAAALIAATVAVGAYRREQRRDASAKAIQIQDQATKFAGWIDADDTRIRLFLKNASDLPIERVDVWFWEADFETTFEDLQVQYRFWMHFRVVAPGQTIIKDVTDDVSEASQWLTVSLNFIDARGLAWARHSGDLNLDPTVPASKQPPRYLDVLLEQKTLIEAIVTVIARIVTPSIHWISSLVKPVIGPVAGFLREILQRNKN